MEQVNEKYVICEGVFHAGLRGHMGIASSLGSPADRNNPRQQRLGARSSLCFMLCSSSGDKDLKSTRGRVPC
jgi:hypothetical protein